MPVGFSAQIGSTVMEFIRCAGCEMIHRMDRLACPSCGRCPNCGTKRVAIAEICAACKLPYCDCCGLCPQCHSARCDDPRTPCECGSTRPRLPARTENECTER